MIITSRHRQLTFFFACALFACLLFIPPSRAESTFSITYFGDLSCNTCVVKEQVLQDFAAQHPEVQVAYNTAAYGSDPNAIHSLQQYFAQFGIQDPSVPAVVLNNSGQINILFTTQT
ncbi:MAG TPA: hypothetical protein VKK79_14960, partial [Candidatus Lokiarchaeia archaeon]|nr:hypothetical protein [Candidatus Lokiarchaeia archaeon]